MGQKFSQMRKNSFGRRQSEEKPDVALVDQSAVKSDDIETAPPKQEVVEEKPSMLQLLAIPLALILYAATAIGKNIFTKAILSDEYYRFPYPLTLSTLSCIFTALACIPLEICIPGTIKLPTKPAFKGVMWVSILTGIDMGLSNIALNRISLPLQQVIKATQVVWVIIFEIIMQNKRPKPDYWIYVLMMVVGAPITALGSAADDFNLFGCILMVVATAIGALKYVAAHDVIRANRKQLGSVGFLYWLEVTMLVYMIPWTCLSGEITRTDGVITWLTDSATWLKCVTLVVSCLMGGFRAYVQFLVLRLCSALQLVFTNIAIQSLVVIVGIILFGVEQSQLLWIGILLTLLGYTIYSVRMALTPKETKH